MVERIINVTVVDNDTEEYLVADAGREEDDADFSLLFLLYTTLFFTRKCCKSVRQRL